MEVLTQPYTINDIAKKYCASNGNGSEPIESWDDLTKHIRSIPLLSDPEEQCLIESRGEKTAKETLFLANLRLVLDLANKHYRSVKKPCSIELPDLFQVGLLGLIKAITGFDHLKTKRFSTYAVPCITTSILGFISAYEEPDGLPWQVRKEICRLKVLLAQGLTEQEAVSQVFKRRADPERIQGVMTRAQNGSLSLDAPINSQNDDERMFGDRIPSENIEEEYFPEENTVATRPPQHVPLGQHSYTGRDPVNRPTERQALNRIIRKERQGMIYRFLAGTPGKTELIIGMLFGLNGHQSCSVEELSKRMGYKDAAAIYHHTRDYLPNPIRGNGKRQPFHTTSFS